MGGRGARSSNVGNTNTEVTANELVERWQEAIEERREQNVQRGNNSEIKAVYDSIEGKQDRYPTIGANTKNFDRIIDNAVTIRHYDQDEMDVRNTTARTPNEVRQMQADIRRDLSRFGRGGRNGMRMYYAPDNDEFVLSYYSGYTYRIKLR